MVYINSSTLIVSDNSQHCIEAFDVGMIQMTTYAGVCGTPGSQLTGHRINDVRLSYATGMAFDGSPMVYSSSRGPAKIISIDTVSDMGHEICGTDGMFARSLVFDEDIQSLYVSLNRAVAKVDVATSKFTVLSGSTTNGDSIGDHRTTEYSYPFGLLQVNASKLVISDRNNNRYL
mgnify:FL=1